MLTSVGLAVRVVGGVPVEVGVCVGLAGVLEPSVAVTEGAGVVGVMEPPATVAVAVCDGDAVVLGDAVALADGVPVAGAAVCVAVGVGADCPAAPQKPPTKR